LGSETPIQEPSFQVYHMNNCWSLNFLNWNLITNLCVIGYSVALFFLRS
jgi:hypothetical protein